MIFYWSAPVSLNILQHWKKTREICSVLGVPLAQHKTEGPTTCLSFLGMGLDTRHMTLRLPRDKLARLQAGIAAWHLKRACTKRDLLSLIGQLQHASCIVKPGHSFLRRMIQLSTVVHHHIGSTKILDQILSGGPSSYQDGPRPAWWTH